MVDYFKTLLFGAVLGLGTMALAPVSLADSMDNQGYVQIRDRDFGDRKWNRDKHGDRCRYRKGECRHFHRGYYYETPWWTLPLIIGGAYDNGRYYDDEDYGDLSSSHVEWCLNRYRSYNPRTNTWVSYSGNVNQCNSPYN
jgi:hypothetical protein